MAGDVRPKRTDEVNRHLARAGIRDVRLVKGPGYFCFEGEAHGGLDRPHRRSAVLE